MTKHIVNKLDDTSMLSTAARQLVDAAMSLQIPLFTVIDGAQYRDLPCLLKFLKIDHRSLFLEHADKEIEAASGWLAKIPGRDELTRLLEASGKECDSFVIWGCSFGEISLYRHLRTINLVQIPTNVALARRETRDLQGKATQVNLKYESVLFRHYDSRVLASLIPILDKLQLARFLGPAETILFHASEQGSLQSIARPIDHRSVLPSLLRISLEKIEKLEEKIANLCRAKIKSYLRQVADQASATMDDHQLEKFVLDCEKSGYELGLTTMRAQQFWTYMILSSQGAILKNPVILDYLLSNPEEGTPNDKIYCLMSELVDMKINQ